MMKLNVVSVTSRTVSIEMEGTGCFYAEKKYDLYANSVRVGMTNKNVFTIGNLNPDSEYLISIKEANTGKTCGEISVRTAAETAVLNVRDFGARGDGENNDTLPIQAAIHACPEGGRVLLPEGTYLSHPIFLKSNITLEIEKGAVLLGAKEQNMYPVLPGLIKCGKDRRDYYLGSWEGEPAGIFASLITGIGVKNVNIIGEGMIDGNADFNTWWHEAKIKKVAWRPRTLFLNRCENILIESLTIKNSPSWTIHPLMSKNLKFIGLNIENPKDAPNTDGLNPESCRDVLIAGNRFSVGDDCVAIKSGKYNAKRRFLVPSENIFVRNCLMESGHGAVVIGSEMSGGVKNVHVERCLFCGTDRGIRIKTRRGRGSDGVIDEIYSSAIKMNKVLTPFTINCFYFCDADGKTEYVWRKDKLPVDERTPFVGKIYFKDITCVDAQVAAGFMYGLPEMKIEKVVMENVYVHFDAGAKPDYPEMMSFIEPMCKNGFYFNNIKTLIIKNVIVENAVTKPFIKLNIENDYCEGEGNYGDQAYQSSRRF